MTMLKIILSHLKKLDFWYSVGLIFSMSLFFHYLIPISPSNTDGFAYYFFSIIKRLTILMPFLIFKHQNITLKKLIILNIMPIIPSYLLVFLINECGFNIKQFIISDDNSKRYVLPKDNYKNHNNHFNRLETEMEDVKNRINNGTLTRTEMFNRFTRTISKVEANQDLTYSDLISIKWIGSQVGFSNEAKVCLKGLADDGAHGRLSGRGAPIGWMKRGEPGHNLVIADFKRVQAVYILATMNGQNN